MKTTIIIILILLSLFMIGCSDSTNQKQSTPQKTYSGQGCGVTTAIHIQRHIFIGENVDIF